MAKSSAPAEAGLTTTLLYDGKVRLDFEESKHVYYVDGSKVPSVTEIVGKIDKSAALTQWASNMCAEHVADNLPPGDMIPRVEIENILSDAKNAHRRIKNKAAGHGTLIHTLAECYVKFGSLPDMDLSEKEKNSFDAFLRWKNEYVKNIISCERFVYSRTHKYAGKTDLVVELNDGRKCIADIKTSKGIYEIEYGAQLSGYSIALFEELGEQFDARIILRCDRETGLLEIKELENYELDRACFLGALQINKRFWADKR